MWSKRFAAIVVLTTTATLGTVTPAADAAGPGEAVFGDFNNDGITDAVVLGAVSPNLCSTIVQYGSASGVFLPPVAYTYLRPGGDIFDCPDLGVAADLNLDGIDDVGVGWSQGAPPGLGYNRILLTPPNFQPFATYRSVITHPTFFGAAVFTPDAPPSPYAIGPGGIASAILTGTTLVPGPIRFCTVDTPAVQLADWQQTGVEGVLLSYTDACADGSSGVVRIRPDGSVQQLERDATGATRWTARVVNGNGDRYPDARTIDQTTGEVTFYINTRSSGMFFLHRAPHAHTDQVTLTGDKPVAIDVFGNDHASTATVLTVVTPPRYGTVQVLSDKRVLYRPRSGHGRADRFTYQLDGEGKRSKATVYLRFPD